MKRIFIGLAIFTLFVISPYVAKAELVSSPEPYDFSNGLLDDEYIIKAITTNTDITAYVPMFDNDLTTEYNFQNDTYINIEFKHPVQLKGVYWNVRSDYSTIYYTFVGGETKTVSHYRDSTKVNYEEINYEDVTKVTIARPHSQGRTIYYELDFFGTYEKEVKIYDKAHSLTAETTYNSINLNWVNPHLLGFKNVLLYVDGKLIDTLSPETTSYTLTRLKPSTSYQIELVALYDDGGKSEQEILSVVTDDVLPEEKEIQKLTAKAKSDRVDLSWQLPSKNDDLQHVNIYRGTVKEVASVSRFRNVASAAEGSDLKKIFETNGTYFNDLTVEENTTYDYKLTVQQTDGTETQGIQTRVTTAVAPPPTLEGLVVSKTESGGGYLVTWDEPTEGEITIIVGGKEVGKVPAGDKEFLIPESEIPKDMLGNPDIQVKVTDSKGKESKPTRPGIGEGIEKPVALPFDVVGLIKTCFDLLKVLAPFILLGLAIRFVPKLIKLIKNTVKTKK